MHIAAQGDQPISMVYIKTSILSNAKAYFREKGVSISEQDDKDSTPLHWAAFLG
jgi:ankyrin repeat protein